MNIELRYCVHVLLHIHTCIYLLTSHYLLCFQKTCTVPSPSSLSCRVPSLPDDVGVGVQFNFTITFDQYILYSHTEGLAQPYLETTANPTFEPFNQMYTLNSGRTISISVSTCNCIVYCCMCVIGTCVIQ